MSQNDDKKVITSLAEFISQIYEIQEKITKSNPNENLSFFYRGHSNKDYQVFPSIFRKDNEGKSHRANEYNIYQEMLRRSPEAFANDNTTFERLVRMQHHGLPTRLLDITSSPQVALYFACKKSKEEEKDGEVLCFLGSEKNLNFLPNIPESLFTSLYFELKLEELIFEYFQEKAGIIKKNANYYKMEVDELETTQKIMSALVKCW